jgi:CspA family cold shock protein
MSRREGIVKWYKEDKGYGRIMLDGQDGNHVSFTSARFGPTR